MEAEPLTAEEIKEMSIWMGRNYHDEPWLVPEAEAEKIHRLFATIAALEKRHSCDVLNLRRELGACLGLIASLDDEAVKKIPDGTRLLALRAMEDAGNDRDTHTTYDAAVRRVAALEAEIERLRRKLDEYSEILRLKEPTT